MTWNPRSSTSWANLLGLVDVPLFWDGCATSRTGSLLLDGQRGTFAFFDVTDENPSLDDDMLSWAWSANALHAVTVDGRNKQLHVHRWDADRTSRQWTMPSKGIEAEKIFEALQSAPKARAATVVQHVLEGFRLIRQALPASAALEAVQALNTFLLAAARVSDDPDIRTKYEHAAVFGEVFSLLDQRDQQFVGLVEKIRDTQIGSIHRHFLEPEPRTGCRLDPKLLFRHASTELYQEAHLDIERGPQSYFAGLAPIDRPKGVAPKDVRFTPTNLARVLVERAIKAYGPLPQDLVVLDPACGSGVFLQQCLRELTSRSFQGTLRLHGYDLSPIASCISRFCLSGPVQESLSPGLNAEVIIRTENALTLEPWVSPHLILMNPPFVSRGYLAPQQLQEVNAVLGENLTSGRVDMAMAFIWKAVNYLQPGGLLATVLPVALLETESGKPWRDAIAELCDVDLVGRFEGYKYFSTSLVETAFAVFRRKVDRPTPERPVTVVVAREAREDAAIRFLRLSEHGIQRSVDGVDLYQATASSVFGERWKPLRKSEFLIKEWAQESALHRVDGLFHVRQGIRTRFKPAFVLKAHDHDALPESERNYFRPAAGQTTIVDGRLFKNEYVFYPYDEAGLRIESESELNKRLPTYVDRHLNRYRTSLGNDQWWALFRARRWQWRSAPKLVAKTYGTSGDFAFDKMGDYAVVQGCAWLWKRVDSDGYVPESLQFAHLALFNSRVFAVLLSVFCRRVQGGQFELAKKFVKDIPIPDLSREDSTSAVHLEALARLGKMIHERGLSTVEDELDSFVMSAYGLPADLSAAFMKGTREGGHAIHP